MRKRPLAPSGDKIPTGTAARLDASNEAQGAHELETFDFFRANKIPLLALLLVRVSAATFTMITDCDETFNYWEPVHFVLFGWGYQTWEYSPVYALRSYLFLLPHMLSSFSFSMLFSRAVAFYGTRVLQAFASWWIERRFAASVQHKFGSVVASNTLMLLLGSAGMFHASVAFLPSTVAMLALMLIWSFWLREQFGPAIFVAVGTILLVWPFVVLLYVPLGLHALVSRSFGLVKVLKWGIGSSVVWTAASVAFDSFFYGRPVFPAWEIFRYNVLDDHGGPELYGVEPAHFFFVNGFLNFNFALLLALVLPLLTVANMLVGSTGSFVAPVVTLSAFYMWFAFMSSIPHKEERFLSPVYPLICLGAAFALAQVSQLYQRLRPRFLCGHDSLCINWILRYLPLALIMGVSGMRAAALIVNYGGPLGVYDDFRAVQDHVPAQSRLCIAGEWYRYPSSFLIAREDLQPAFVRNGNASLLPLAYNRSVGTNGIPPNMNDQNREEPSRYVDPATCDYFLELLPPAGEATEKWRPEYALRLHDDQDWTIVASRKFLDASRSQFPWRAFEVPFISATKNSYAKYALVKRVTRV